MEDSAYLLSFGEEELFNTPVRLWGNGVFNTPMVSQRSGHFQLTCYLQSFDWRSF